MKLILSAAVLGCILAPVTSMSYLDQLGSGAPASVAAPGQQAANGATYLDALVSPASTAPTGGGMTSYLDALPPQPATSGGGGGMTSFADNLSPGAASTPAFFAPPPPAAAAPAAAAPAAAAPAASDTSFSAPAASGGNYLEAISAAATSGSPTGGGMTSYLDVLPREAPASGGAGIQTYTDALPITNTAAGTGAGMATYADIIQGGVSTFSKSFSPSGGSFKTPSPSFVGSVGGSQIDFTLEASDLSSLVSQLQGAGGTIRLTGSIEGVSFS